MSFFSDAQANGVRATAAILDFPADRIVRPGHPRDQVAVTYRGETDVYTPDKLIALFRTHDPELKARLEAAAAQLARADRLFAEAVIAKAKAERLLQLIALGALAAAVFGVIILVARS